MGGVGNSQRYSKVNETTNDLTRSKTASKTEINPMKICLVALNAYGVLAGNGEAHFGGAEVQASLISRWFSERGHQFSVITWNDGGKKIEYINGVRIIKTSQRTEGIRFLRFFWPRWRSLNKALAVADADIYLQSCAEHTTGQIALWCRVNSKPFVYLVASDRDCVQVVEMKLPFLGGELFRYGLRNANLVIAQTSHQKKLLKKNHAILAKAVPMAGLQIGAEKLKTVATDAEPKRVLWIGRIARLKRVEILIDVAKKMPDVHFDVVGQPDDSTAYVTKVMNKIKSTKNVTFFGPLPRSKLLVLYRSARILCCTSSLEGFPNVFLESWSNGIPVISTVDPDGVIERFGLGFYVKNENEIIEAIRKLNMHSIWSDTSKRSIAYYEQYHMPDSVFSKYEKLFMEQTNKCEKRTN